MSLIKFRRRVKNLEEERNLVNVVENVDFGKGKKEKKTSFDLSESR